MSGRAMPMADRISALPDIVLCHILSFMPTKLAVATSVLSKRWRPLWLSLHTLDFDDEYVCAKEAHFRFHEFVYGVMLTRDVSQPIKTFRLRCWSPLCDPSNVNKWVNAAMQRRVEHLDLSLPCNVNLPSSILSSRTLVVLKLKRLTVKTLSHVDFPSLKIMHLERVHFPERRYLKEFLSGCPILEDLQTKYIPVGPGEVFKSLPKLVRADISNFDIPLKAIYNVEFLRIEEVNPYDKDISTFHNLTHMELIFLDFNWHWLLKVLKHCPKLQILVVDKMKMHETCDENWAYPQFVPECLLLHLRTCSFRNYGGLEGELLFARYIMKNARVLQTMTICSTSISAEAKLQMVKKLSLCPRRSVTCELSFE